MELVTPLCLPVALPFVLQYGVVLMRHFPFNLLSQILLLAGSCSPPLPTSASTLHSCFYFLVVVVKMRTYLSFPLQFVLILICCPSYTLAHTCASIASAREPFACHSISNSLNQSVRHTVSLSVRLSVSLALSVSHCVNTLITGGKRCATHTHSCTYTHIRTYVAGSHVYCWQFFALLVAPPPRLQPLRLMTFVPA